MESLKVFDCLGQVEDMDGSCSNRKAGAVRERAGIYTQGKALGGTSYLGCIQDVLVSLTVRSIVMPPTCHTT